MKVGIVAKRHRTDFAERLQAILGWLGDRHCTPLVDRDLVEAYGFHDIEGFAREQLVEQSDFIVVFGGDGTMLSAARSVSGSGTPILGVNMGSLGFLTSVRPEELYPALERVLARDYYLDRRTLLRAAVYNNGGDEPKVYHALNDVVVNKGTLARIISMHVALDDDPITEYLADGLIISTPTGSTAYSLSAGGPILYPELEAFIVTPICPHTLTNRPIVAPSDRAISVTLKEGDDVMLTVDGQVGVELTPGAEIVCTRSHRHIDLLQPGDKTFFDVLRDKLKWGER
ncbi:MAG TPA: NAD(+)/NADH kinase [Acidobacteriota bacterium]|nr:NAD(+)/NADH kinase [Acidobacteriota bacterium]